MKRQKMICLAGLLLILFVTGCRSKENEKVEGPYLYYRNTDGTGLSTVEYTIQEKDAGSAVDAMLQELSKSPDSVEMRSAIPKDVKVEDAVLDEGVLHLYMNEVYSKLDKVQEVLVRSALVQSLIQIDGVETVDMFVGNKPLTLKSGKPVGRMDDKSFVRNTGTAFKSFQKTTLTLFYANGDGDKLVSEKEEVHYFGNISMETLVLEQLMKEPKQGGMIRTLSPEIRILNTSVKDGICYVNLGKEFLTHPYDATPETVVYGIVNSIVSNCDVSRVQFAVEGDSAVKFMGKISFEEPFERNIELVENE